MCPCNSNSRKHRWLKKTCSGSPFTHCDALWPFFLHWELVLLASHVNDWMFFYKRPNWIWNTDPKVFHSSILTTTVTPTSILWPSCQLLDPNFIPHLKHFLHWHQEVLWGGGPWGNTSHCNKLCKQECQQATQIWDHPHLERFNFSWRRIGEVAKRAKHNGIWICWGLHS